MYRYKTSGVCSSQIDFDIVDNKITHVTFYGGCNGNTQGISLLVEGMDVDDAISRLKGVRCGGKGTSCPDQLARALEQATKQSFRSRFYAHKQNHPTRGMNPL